MPNQLFVYGSLRQGFQNNRILQRFGAEFIGPARLPGYDLHAVTWYPGIKPNESNQVGVLGEVYKLPENTDEIMNTLDLYEGYSKDNEPGSLFVRREVAVNGEPAYVYVYNGRVEGGKIQSGDWEDSRR